MPPFDGSATAGEDQCVAPRRKEPRVSRAIATKRLEALGARFWFLADEELEPVGTVLVALSEALKYGELDDRRIVRMLSEAKAFTESLNLETGRTPTRLPQPSRREAYQRAVQVVGEFLQDNGDAKQLPRLQRSPPSRLSSSNVLAWSAGTKVHHAVRAFSHELDAEAWSQLLEQPDNEPALRSAIDVVDLGLVASGVSSASLKKLHEADDKKRRRDSRRSK